MSKTIRSCAALSAMFGSLLLAMPGHAQEVAADDVSTSVTTQSEGADIAEGESLAAPVTDEQTQAAAGAEAVAPDTQAGEAVNQGARAMAGALPAAAPVKSDWGVLQPFMNLVEAGGPIILILGILSVVSLMIIVVKLIQFALLRVSDHRFTGKVSQMLKAGNMKGALEFVMARRGVVSRVMEAALIGKSRGFPEPIVREETERVARAKLDGLERGLSLLSLIATISPLLGLLGTVLGMIEAFQQLQNAGDKVDPAILSGGIWEALLTTAAGLTVAIPAAVFYTWLQRSVDVAAQHMEDAAVRVFTADLYVQTTVEALAEEPAKAA